MDWEIWILVNLLETVSIIKSCSHQFTWVFKKKPFPKKGFKWPEFVSSVWKSCPRKSECFLDMKTQITSNLATEQAHSHKVWTFKQTWDLSKNLHDRRFQGKKFTQKTRNFWHLLNRDKKCVNALNWDKTSKKCSVTM